LHRIAKEGCVVTQRRVVITGLGIVAPNGIGKAEFWRNLLAGKSAVDRVFAFDASGYPCQVAAEVRDFSPTDFLTPDKAKTIGRFSQLAVAATRLAIDDAKLPITRQGSEQVGVACGTSIAGVGDLAATVYRGFFADGLRGIQAATAIEYPAHFASVHVASEFKIRGPAITVSTNCCTGLDTIYAAYAQVKLGKVNASLASAADAPIFPATFGSFCSFTALTRRNDDPQAASRPYDKLHDGIVLAEGGATLVLEELEFAMARGAKIYAEVLGHGAANEVQSPLRHATGRTMARAIRAALTDAAVDAAEIDHINAHGCGLPHSDVCDTNAFKQVLGERAYRVPVTSIKSMVGQALAAAGVFQTATACLSIDQQRVPPTINLEERDPHCDLDYVPNVSRRAVIDRVLINGQGFGGSYAALVIGRPPSADGLDSRRES
jgi:3-oxoacyl-[acyl-carrier-protein] synthase II